jgi:hypothetical protein
MTLRYAIISAVSLVSVVPGIAQDAAGSDAQTQSAVYHPDSESRARRQVRSRRAGDGSTRRGGATRRGILLCALGAEPRAARRLEDYSAAARVRWPVRSRVVVVLFMINTSATRDGKFPRS